VVTIFAQSWQVGYTYGVRFSITPVTVKNDCNTSEDIEELCSDDEIDSTLSESDTVINGSSEALNLMHA